MALVNNLLTCVHSCQWNTKEGKRQNSLNIAGVSLEKWVRFTMIGLNEQLYPVLKHFRSPFLADPSLTPLNNSTRPSTLYFPLNINNCHHLASRPLPNLRPKAKRRRKKYLLLLFNYSIVQDLNP